MALLPVEIQQLAARLRIGAHHRFAGRWSGERRGRAKGEGLDFADYRGYQPGDDLRYVDWPLYARLGRLYLKAFFREQNLPLTVLMDVSQSMTLGEPSKLTHAKTLAALLGYIALSHLETMRLLTMAEGILTWFPVLHGRAQLVRLESLLNTYSVGGQTDLQRAVSQYLQKGLRPGVVFVISDLLSQTPCQPALKRLAKAGNDVHVVQILTPDEVQPSVRGDFRLIDVETSASREIRLDEATADAYRLEMERFWSEMRRFCAGNQMSFVHTVVGEPLTEIVLTLRRNGVLHG